MRKMLVPICVPIVAAMWGCGRSALDDIPGLYGCQDGVYSRYFPLTGNPEGTVHRETWDAARQAWRSAGTIREKDLRPSDRTRERRDPIAAPAAGREGDVLVTVFNDRNEAVYWEVQHPFVRSRDGAAK
jgi:hypothetical protein